MNVGYRQSIRILVVEDEPSLNAVLGRVLTEALYDVEVAQTYKAGAEAIDLRRPDLLLLDLMLPDGDGLDLLARFRAQSDAPVLVLSARGELGDRVHGLDTGADDYMAKPFSVAELLARIQALVRRAKGSSERVQIGNLTVDFGARKVTRAGRTVFLSTTEYALLELLARTPGRVLGKSEILRHVWDDEQRGPNVVEVYVNYLRHKLERNGSERLIHTVRGRGYVLSETWAATTSS